MFVDSKLSSPPMITTMATLTVMAVTIDGGEMVMVEKTITMVTRTTMLMVLLSMGYDSDHSSSSDDVVVVAVMIVIVSENASSTN